MKSEGSSAKTEYEINLVALRGNSVTSVLRKRFKHREHKEDAKNAKEKKLEAGKKSQRSV